MSERHQAKLSEEHHSAFIVLSPAGIGDVWVVFKVTTDRQEAYTTAMHVEGLVAVMPIIDDQSKRT